MNSKSQPTVKIKTNPSILPDLTYGDGVDFSRHNQSGPSYLYEALHNYFFNICEASRNPTGHLYLTTLLGQTIGNINGDISLSALINTHAFIDMSACEENTDHTTKRQQPLKVSCAILALALNNSCLRDLLNNSTISIEQASQEAYKDNPDSFKIFCLQVLATDAWNLDAFPILIKTLFHNDDLSSCPVFKDIAIRMGSGKFFQLNKEFSLFQNNPDFFKVQINDQYGSRHEEFLPALAVIFDSHLRTQRGVCFGRFTDVLSENLPVDIWNYSKHDTALVKAQKSFFLTSILTRLFKANDGYQYTEYSLIYHLGVKNDLSKADPYYITGHTLDGPIMFGDFLISQGGYNKFKQIVPTKRKLTQYLHHPQTNLLARFFLPDIHSFISNSHFPNIKQRDTKGKQLLQSIISIEQSTPSPSNMFEGFIRRWVSEIISNGKYFFTVHFKYSVNELFGHSDTSLNPRHSTASLNVLDFYDRIGADLLAPSQLIKVFQNTQEAEPYLNGCLLSDAIFLISTTSKENASSSFLDPNGFFLKKLHSLDKDKLNLVFTGVTNLIRSFSPMTPSCDEFIRNQYSAPEKDESHPLLVALMCFHQVGVTNFSQEIRDLYLEESALIQPEHPKYQSQLHEIKKASIVDFVSQIAHNKERSINIKNKI